MQRYAAGASAALLAIALAACGGDDGSGDGEPAAKPAAFGYSGANGPSHWGSLDPAYKECSAGKRQSPIDLRGGEASDLPRVAFSYRIAHEPQAENNGHGVELAYPRGSSIELGGMRYELDQLHFHSPSEHKLKGRSYPLEFHLVHKADDGSAAVLGVFAEEGRANPAFSNLVRALPLEEGEEVSVAGDVNALDLLPSDATSTPRWSYEGSLTTPPCSEPVGWDLYDRPIELSKDQIAKYEAVNDHNNRPVQPLDGRRLLFSR